MKVNRRLDIVVCMCVIGDYMPLAVDPVMFADIDTQLLSPR